MSSRQPILSDSWSDISTSNFAVVTNSKKWGFGVYSVHVAEYDATHNAKITGGKKVPLDHTDREMFFRKIRKRRTKKKEPYHERFCNQS